MNLFRLMLPTVKFIWHRVKVPCIPPYGSDCGIGLETAEGITQQEGLKELDVIFDFLSLKGAVQNDNWYLTRF